MSHTSGSKVELVDRDGIDMIAAPAGHVSVVLKAAGSKERTCGGRLPDAIMDSSVGLALPGRGGSVGTTSTDLALGGRNPQVLIVRELLYRLCEIGLNGDLPAQDLVELYKDTLPMIEVALKSSVVGTAATAIAGVSPNLNMSAGNNNQPASPSTESSDTTDPSASTSASDPNATDSSATQSSDPSSTQNAQRTQGPGNPTDPGSNSNGTSATPSSPNTANPNNASSGGKSANPQQ